VDNISSMDGASMTILLSENEDAGHWIWYFNGDYSVPLGNWGRDVPSAIYPNDYIHHIESSVAFCFPRELTDIASGEIPLYEPATVLNATSPLFINEGRTIRYNGYVPAGHPVGEGLPLERIRKARPSSGHPGAVVTAFVDGGVRTLRDDVDRTLFVRLCRPGSGVIINPKDLGW